jgi:hypothetical protein
LFGCSVLYVSDNVNIIHKFVFDLPKTTTELGLRPLYGCRHGATSNLKNRKKRLALKFVFLRRTAISPLYEITAIAVVLVPLFGLYLS